MIQDRFLEITVRPVRSFEGIMPTIPESAYIDPMSTIIGDVELGEDVSVWPMAVIRGDVNKIRIGEQSNIQDGAVLHVSHQGEYRESGGELVLGRGVTVGHQTMLHACHIGDYCLIGMGATVMDDVVVGEYTIIGAGALVTPGKILEPRSMYVGAPMRKVRDLSEKEIKQLKYSAEHYVRVKAKYQ